MKINQIAIVSIPVSDQQRAKSFYQDILGFELIAENRMGPDQLWIQLRPAGAQTSITLVTWFEKMPPGSVQGVVLDIDDVTACRDELIDKGVDVSPIDAQPYGKFATFADPDGNSWVLQESPFN